MPDTGQISDGYHTFDELYEHRIALFLALCSCNHESAWKSRFHSDGSSYDGWFVLGLNHEPGHQITYHLPNDKWDSAWFAKTMDHAPEFDGHSPSDVVARLYAQFCFHKKEDQ